MGEVTRPVTIPAGASDSQEVWCEQYKLAAIYMPAAWDVAQITFRGSFESGGTFLPVYDKTGNEYVAIVAAGRYVVLPLLELAGLRYVKIRSGTDSNAVNQTSARTVLLLLSHL